MVSLIRSILKFFIRKFTGTCQIERAARNHNHVQLQNSIKLSKKISQNLKKKLFSEDFTSDMFEELCAFKNIVNAKSKSDLSKLLNEVRNIFKAISMIQNQRKTKYQKDNQEHQKLLLQLWKILKPDQQLVSRLSKQWIDIGFQDQDPATDFRGAGFLGLINLVEYVKTTEGMKCFETASNKNTQFFFCSAGLFMTIFSVNLVKQRKLDKYFYICEDSLKGFQEIYNKVFNRFHEYWKQCEDKSMMSLNKNMEAFKVQIKRNVAQLN